MLVEGFLLFCTTEQIKFRFHAGLGILEPSIYNSYVDQLDLGSRTVQRICRSGGSSAPVTECVKEDQGEITGFISRVSIDKPMSNAQEQTTGKWRGLLKQPVQVPVDKAWNVFRDFCGLNKWVKTITRCDLVEGEEGKPGCVRYLTGSTFAADNKSWAKERLLFLDDENHTMSYEMLGGSIELVGYQAWVKVEYLDNNSATVTWNYETNPMEGRTEEQLEQLMVKAYGLGLKYLQEYAVS